MVRRFAAVALVALITLPAIGARAPRAERYVIDTSHTYVGFTVKHLAISNVRGKFTRFGGEIMLDESDITKSTVNITIEANSLDTSNDRRDEHLRSADFFDVEKFPQLRFASRRIERDADGLVLVGDLTIRDVTKEVRIPFELTGPVTGANGKRLGAEGTVRVNRFDYGLQWNRLQEAVAVVGEEVRIELNVEAATPRNR